MKASFEDSASVLVRAYMNDTLVHGNCSACAVGNLIASAIGKKPVPVVAPCFRFDDNTYTEWNKVFSSNPQKCQRFYPENYTEKAKEFIDSTGYTLDELRRIEFAFESAPGYQHEAVSIDDNWMFNGLLAVVEVLADIHSVDFSTKELAIDRFLEVHATK